MNTKPPAVEQRDESFIKFARMGDAIASSDRNEAETLEAIRRATEDFVMSWRMPDPRFLACQPDAPYASYLLFVNESSTFSIVLDVFMPGQAAVIHNHRCWCSFTCLEGVERERLYAVDPNLSAPPQQIEERICRVGSVRVLGSDRHLFHQVECASDEATVSLHIYGADIGRLKRDMWDADAGAGGEYVNFKSHYSNTAAGVPAYFTD